VTGVTSNDPFGRVYGLAHFGKSLTWYYSELLFAYFLTEICGLSPQAMGWTLAASLLFSGAVDLLVGKVLTAPSRSLARVCAIQFPGALASGVGLVAFSATSLVAPAHRLVFALAASCLFRLCYAFYDVPQNSMLSLGQITPSRRMKLSAIRITFSGLASLAIAATAALLISPKASQGPTQFLSFTAIIGLLGVTSALMLSLYGRRLGAPGRDPVPEPVEAKAPAPSGGIAFSLLLVALSAGATGAFGRLEPYFAARALANPLVRTVVLGMIALGGAAAQPAWLWVAHRTSARMAFRASNLVMVVGAGLFLLGAGRGAAAAGLSGLVFGGGVSGAGMLLWGALAQSVARPAGGARSPSPALAFAMLTCAIKLASAIAVLGVGALLSSIDYHDPKVAGSWALLGPMTGAPVIAAILCQIFAHRVFGPGAPRAVEEARRDQPPEAPRALARAASRILVRVVPGMIASGSIFRWRIEGRPEDSAASKAAAKSAVRSTVAPKPPKARA
jgi:Na+/melibiose symporter-like transporter